MSLLTEVQARYSPQRLVALSNPDAPAATTENAAVEAVASTDVQAEFEVYAGVAYDGTDARHVAIGVQCFILRLRELHQNEDGDALRQKRQSLLKDLGRVTGRNRILPHTDSVLTPSVPTGTGPFRPDFDKENFGVYGPQPPGAVPRYPRDNM